MSVLRRHRRHAGHFVLKAVQFAYDDITYYQALQLVIKELIIKEKNKNVDK